MAFDKLLGGLSERMPCGWGVPLCMTIVIVVVCLSGCAPSVGSVIANANRENDARAVQRGNALLAAHLKLIERLRADGDPMGDYLWTRANADQWLENPINDPLVLKRMYEEAAAKGSIDAQHMVGLMLFDGSASRSGVCNDCPVLKPEARDWKKGLAILEDATRKQCYYWAVVLDGMANQSCLKPSITATVVWPKFRDGFAYPKDGALESYWRAKGEQCRAQLATFPPMFYFRQKFPICP